MVRLAPLIVHGTVLGQVNVPGVAVNESSKVRSPFRFTVDGVGPRPLLEAAPKVTVLLIVSGPVPKATLAPTPTLPALMVAPPSYVPLLRDSVSFPAPFLTSLPPPTPLMAEE